MRLTPVRRIVALTFDDGPADGTEAVLDIFREHGAVGTFFLLGMHVPGRESTVRRIVAEGSEIGNHTFSHARLETLPAEAIREELQSASAVITRAAGVAPRLMRPPRGLGCRQTAPVAAELGMTTVRWTINTRDWEHEATAERTVTTVLDSIEGADTVVLHDGSPDGQTREETVAAVATLVPQLAAAGYRLVTLSTLLARRPLAHRHVVPFPRNRALRTARGALAWTIHRSRTS